MPTRYDRSSTSHKARSRPRRPLPLEAPRKRANDDDIGTREKSPPKRPKYYTKEDSRRDDQAFAPVRRGTRAQVPPKTTSVNELKNKIRDAKRLLSRAEKLPADVRVEKERAIKGYERELEQAEARKARKSMIEKYHFVRFLERKRASKTLNRLMGDKAELEEENASPGRHAELETQIHATRVDLNYSIYCPLTEKYIALYPTSEKGKEKEREAKKREEKGEQPAEPEDPKLIRNNAGEKPPLWYVVEECMKDGTLELLRDGKLGVGLSGERTKSANNAFNLPVLERKRKKAKESASTSKPGAASTASKNEGAVSEVAPENDTQMADSEDECDGGGFFEI